MISAVAQAAQVTDVKWGLSKDNVLRVVVDVTEYAGYAVNIDGDNLNLVVNAPKAAQVKTAQKVKSSFADSMSVKGVGSNTIVTLPLKQRLSTGDYKAFCLKKDPKTGRPFRIVLDVSGGKKVASTNSAVVGKPVVSNRPVVGNTPVSTYKKPAVVNNNSSDDKKESKEPKKETAIVKPVSKEPVKDDSFKTSGGLKGKVITLDAGHGGSDPGALGASGTKEKDITLAITNYVKEYLEDCGAKVHMTRTSDVDVYGPNASDKDELQARVNVGERSRSDIFVSLHINSSVNKNIGGFSTYYYPKTNNDLRLAQKIQHKLASNFGVDDLGVRQANFYVVKRISMPAVLVEMCFISNPKEEKLMKGKWFQKKTAKMIVEGIEEYFG